MAILCIMALWVATFETIEKERSFLLIFFRNSESFKRDSRNTGASCVISWSGALNDVRGKYKTIAGEMGEIKHE